MSKNILAEQWFQELAIRLKARNLTEHQIDKTIEAWKFIVRRSLHWLGYVVIDPDESLRIIDTAIEDADFDLQKYRVDHTTHPLTF
jgi:hypothetical protein